MAKFRGGIIHEDLPGDFENSMILSNKVARNIMEESPVGEPQANEAERPVNKYRPMLKTWKTHVEAKLGIKVTGVLMSWLKIWAAECYDRTCAGRDEKTPWERMAGRKCKNNPAVFGEVV